MSRSVRAGYEVVEKAMRRSYQIAGDPLAAAGWARAPWTPGRWADAMTGAITQWAQWMEGWTAMSRSFAGAAPDSYAAHAAPAPAPSPAPALRVTIELGCARPVHVQLDLATPPASDLQVHGLIAPAAAAAPPITDLALALDGDAVRIRVGALDHHPAATYAGAVLSAGRACGTLTIQLF